MDLYVAPIPTLASKPAIQEFGEKVSGRLGLTPGGSVDDIVRLLGGKITHDMSEDCGDTGSSSIIIRDLRNFTIFLPSTTTHFRNRFTVAHELGHLFPAFSYGPLAVS
jgi:hypothetical protein